MNTKRHGLNGEKIIAYALISMCATIGVMIFILLILGIDARQCDPAALVSLFALGTGTSWGIMLCRNC